MTRKYKDWLGERQLLQKQIAQITEAYETLPEKRDRARTVDRLINSVEIIMAEVVPDWDPATETPTRKGASKLPFEAASVMRWTFDILREADQPLRSRTIAERIMVLNGRS
ncbi:MAG: hypothetical protein JSR79_01310, partial [Proteobacteria bacterium]|nr:hypothetical protein [Pseudomonadota bacterium]